MAEERQSVRALKAALEAERDAPGTLFPDLAEPARPTYEELTADLSEAVQTAAALRQLMLDAGFHSAFAHQVANQFLWQSLGLIIIEDKP